MLQEIARQLRPRTLRAVFGETKVQNAVHCTDLPEDGLLEVMKLNMNIMTIFRFSRIHIHLLYILFYFAGGIFFPYSGQLDLWPL